MKKVFTPFDSLRLILSHTMTAELGKRIPMALLLLFCACAAPGTAQRTAETAAALAAGDSLQYPPVQKETLPPYHPASPGFFRPQPQRTDKPDTLKLLQLKPSDSVRVVAVANDSITPPQLPPPPPMESDRTVQGFRIQLIATTSQQEAQQIEARARELYGAAVYLIFDAPQYKVRVGNFTSRDQANQFRKQVQTDGFKDAWFVPSSVFVPD